MAPNTVLIVDDNINRKNVFIDKMNKLYFFSYAKLEIVFKSIMKAFPDEFNIGKKDYLNLFLNNYLNNLSKSNEKYVIEVDKLSLDNANLLMEKYSNLAIVYLKKQEKPGKYFELKNIDEIEMFIGGLKWIKDV